MVQENGAQNSPYLISRQRDYNAGLDTSHVPALACNCHIFIKIIVL